MKVQTQGNASTSTGGSPFWHSQPTLIRFSSGLKSGLSSTFDDCDSDCLGNMIHCGHRSSHGIMIYGYSKHATGSTSE